MLILILLHRYGLAPNYGCCTANFNQGWPKFAQYVVMELEAGQGLVVATYSPVSIQHTLSSGQKVTLDMITDYPFNDTATIKVDCGSSMQLSLLIPSWTVGPTLSVNQSFPQSLTPGEESNCTFPVLCKEKSFKYLCCVFHMQVLCIP